MPQSPVIPVNTVNLQHPYIRCMKKNVAGGWICDEKGFTLQWQGKRRNL
jgi:hypothetical protein